MTPERYQQIKAAFRLALEYPPSDRKAFVCQHCVNDPSLIPAVFELLESDAAPETPLDRPAVGTEFRLRALSLSYTATRH